MTGEAAAGAWGSGAPMDRFPGAKGSLGGGTLGAKTGKTRGRAPLRPEGPHRKGTGNQAWEGVASL